MGAFSTLLNAPNAARHTLLLPPSAFAETWAKRPTQPALVGIRLVSEQAAEFAQIDALAKAWEAHPEPSDSAERLDIFNSWNITNVLARAVVRAEDVSMPYFAPGPEDLIREALSRGGILRLWDEFEKISITDGPLRPEIDDAELALWPELEARVKAAAPGEQANARRLLWAACDVLRVEG